MQSMFYEGTFVDTMRFVKEFLLTESLYFCFGIHISSSEQFVPLAREEYDMPNSIPSITINRIQATRENLSLIPSLKERMNRSVLGQLTHASEKWDKTVWNNNFVMKGHGGQSRCFSVNLKGEGVQDYGGPYRELFETIVAEIQWTDLLVVLAKTNNADQPAAMRGKEYFVFEPLDPSHELYSLQNQMICALGKLMGAGIRNGIRFNVHLLPAIWKIMADEALDINDLDSLDHKCAMDMLDILSSSQEQFTREYRSLKWSSYSLHGLKRPVSNRGMNDVVKYSERQEYVKCVIMTRLNEFQNQFMVLVDGLNTALPTSMFHLFYWESLELLFAGDSTVNMSILRHHCLYEGFTADEPVIVWLWSVIDELSREERIKFLMFVASRTSLPAQNIASSFKFRISKYTPSHGTPDQFCPLSSTCFFNLKIPLYSSKDILKKQLLLAINNTTTMDADIRLHNADGWN